MKTQFQGNVSVFQVVEIMHLIWGQISIDIFFIDWERPQTHSSTIHSRSQLTSTLPDNSEQPVSIWRTYFVANEWNEIQTTRKISLFFQLVLTVFVLKVNAWWCEMLLGWTQWWMCACTVTVDSEPFFKFFNFTWWWKQCVFTMLCNIFFLVWQWQ